MCGIAGIVGAPVDSRLLRAMARIQAHRGPDEEGVYHDKDVGLASRRLKVIDLAGGQQPMTNEDESVRLVFNGEIYNFKELRARLDAKGHRFKSKSDTETIVHLYEDEGDSCVRELEGMFAFALWDAPRQRLLLARDRIGIKPLYYRIADGRLAFASELKALLLDPACPREVSLRALELYLAFLYIPSPLTIFSGIQKLEPGHYLVFENGRATLRPYWELPGNERQLTDRQEILSELEGLLGSVVGQHLVSDVPLGVFLSSGLDSSTLVALMHQTGARGTKTFTLDFTEGSFSEAAGARLVSRRFGAEHRELMVHPHVVDLLPKLVWHLDEPLGDSSLIPTYLVASFARREVTVALSGIGGDELFAGYPRYLGAKLARRYEQLPLFVRQQLAHLARFIPDSSRSDNPTGRVRRFLQGGILPATRRYLGWRSFFSPAALAELFSRDGSIDPFAEHVAHLEQAPRSVTDPYFYLDLKTYLPEDLLMLADKMTMANSLELRVPYCDHRLVEYMARVSPERRLPGFRLKAILKDLMAQTLPGEILNHPKRGFSLPLATWFKGPLRDLPLELLSEAQVRRRGYFSPGTVRQLVERHLTGVRSYFDQIFALIVFELWHQAYLDGWATRQSALLREVD